VGELVSQNQHAFLQGRQIGECTTLAHELIRDFTKAHGKRACIKVDLQKAFDSINREFVYYIMHCMKFPAKWIGWIKECIATPSFSILLNGSSTGFFGSNRGIRQGDPLSPYIFVMVMEFWSIRMELANVEGKIQNFKRSQELQVSHLLFADDMLVFCRANKHSFDGLNNLLSDLSHNTGLNINRSKSKVFFSTGCSNRGELCSILGISKGRLPVKYLGLPLSVQYPKSIHYGPLLDKLRAKTDGWLAQSLSFAGRLELIKTVLYSILSYWYFSYEFPEKIIGEIERICANFLWKGRMHTMRWRDICKPKREGGFGLRSVQDMCAAAGMKMIWRLLTSDSVWNKWMKRRYLNGQSFWDSSVSLGDSGTWKFMKKFSLQAQECMRKVIGNGKSTSLWFEPWLKEGNLADILNLSSNQIASTYTWKVCRIIRNTNWTCLIPLLNSVWPSIVEIQIQQEEDHWLWTVCSSGHFSFTSAWNHCRISGPLFDLHDIVWFPESSPKMSCCLLKALYDKLPTRARLHRFGIINFSHCVLCDTSCETRDHLFFECPFSAYIWTVCKLKLKLNTPMGNLSQEAHTIKDQFKQKDKVYKLARLAINATVWHIWQERNRRIFQRQKLHKIMVFRRIYEDIKVLLRTCVWKVNNKETILSNWGL
jgi:hypothetical protein